MFPEKKGLIEEIQSALFDSYKSLIIAQKLAMSW